MSHASKKRHKGAGHDEEHGNSERWLLTYADMITLLMVLFIVLFAISAVDQKKFAALKNGIAAGFGAQTVFDGGTGALRDDGQENSAFTINPDVPSAPRDPAQQQAIHEAISAADRAKVEAQLKAAQREVSEFKKVQKQIEQSLANAKVNAAVQFRIDERGLVVTIVTNSVVFAGDRAELLPAGQRIVAAIGGPLRRLSNRIEVDGHTNQLPVPTRRYPSAWELSTARACTVVRYLVGSSGLAASRLTAAGFAGERPLYRPSDPRAPVLNRRVEIVVASALTAAERALLPTAAGG
ncbi:MAG TPA: flagellar motor protein MotB [Mycobacteriales bacterium]|nr:flagellar motor protein MotB [Mycobacteriales bacterium]